MKKKKKSYSFRVHVLHPLIIGFAIIAFWRGLWGLMDLYVFPENEALSFVVSAFIGLVILYFNDLDLSEITN